MRFNGTKLIGIVAAVALMCGVVATASAQPSAPNDASANVTNSANVASDVNRANNANRSNGVNDANGTNDSTNKQQTAATSQQSVDAVRQAEQTKVAAKAKAKASADAQQQPANNQPASEPSVGPQSVGPQSVGPQSEDDDDNVPEYMRCELPWDAIWNLPIVWWKPGMRFAGSTTTAHWKIGKENGQCVLYLSADAPESQLPFTPSVADFGTGWIDFYNYPAPGHINRVVFEGTGKFLLPPDSSKMFEGMNALESVDFNGRVDTRNVTDMNRMFYKDTKLSSVDLSGWDTSQVRDMSLMFLEDSALPSVNVSGWDTSQVRNMLHMFEGDSVLSSIDVSHWNTGNVTNMEGMFWDCTKLTSLDVANWDVRKVTTMEFMFENCALKVLDISGWNTRNNPDMDYFIGNWFNDADTHTCVDTLQEFIVGKDTVLGTGVFKMVSGFDRVMQLFDGEGKTLPSSEPGVLNFEQFQTRTAGSDPLRAGIYARALNVCYSWEHGCTTNPSAKVSLKYNIPTFLPNDPPQQWATTVGVPLPQTVGDVPASTTLYRNVKVPSSSVLKYPPYSYNQPPENNFNKFYRFVAWNTKADGTGVTYHPGDELPVSGDMTLYGQWKRVATYHQQMQMHARYVLRYAMNPPADSGVSEPEAKDEESSVADAYYFNLMDPHAVTIGHKAYPAIHGYRFDGWTMSGDSKVYKPGDQVQVVPGFTDLKGHWTKVYTYSLKFDSNASKDEVTGSMPKVDSVGPVADTSHTFTIPANGFVRAGWHFTGWNTKAAGNGQSPVSANGVDMLTLNSDKPAVTLYAQWVPEYTYSLSFVSGLPEGTASKAFVSVKGEATTADSSALKIPASSKYYREDKQRWQFTGWSDGMGHTYQPGDVVNLTSANPHVVLTGQWVRAYTYSLRFQPTAKSDKAKVTRSFAAIDGGITTDNTMTMTIPAKYQMNNDDSGRYQFSSWADRDGNTYKPGDHIVLKGDKPDVTLYGVWKLVPIASSSAAKGSTVTAQSVAPVTPVSPVASTNPQIPSVPSDPSGLVQVASPALPVVAPVAVVAKRSVTPTKSVASRAITAAPAGNAAASQISNAAPQAAVAPLAVGVASRVGVAPKGAIATPQTSHDGIQSMPQTPAPKDWRNVECGTSGAAYVINLAGYRVMASGNVCAAPKPAASVVSGQRTTNAPVWLWAIVVAAAALVCAVYVNRSRSIEAQHHANER